MRPLILVLATTLSLQGFTQTATPFLKFGKIKPEHLQTKYYPLDSNASAVVLSDVGQAEIVGNNKGYFSVSVYRHRLVHILTKEGYDKADVSIPLSKSGEDEEKLTDVKAVTYNLEGGKLVESKLDRNSIFKEKVNDHWSVRKFTLPNVKEGCVIEYEYTVVSDYISNLDPWTFQEDIPVIWSEFTLSVPEFYTYAFLGHGYHPFFISDRKNKQMNFSVAEARSTSSSGRVSFTAGVTDYRWVMKDLPAIRDERFSSALKNHRSSLEFQLASQKAPLADHVYRSTWPALTTGLLQAEYFGERLSRENNWLSDEVKPLMVGTSSKLQKAQRIFAFVRDNFTCTGAQGIYVSQNLKTAVKQRKGSESEINMILTAMLRFADLDADPVILSTTDHGYALDIYPMITSFNYVVTKFNDEGRSYYLDASHNRLGFGKLLPECYNGHARVVNADATPLHLSADSLNERKLTTMFISNNASGEWTGSFKTTAGYYESYRLRNRLKEYGVENLSKELEKEHGSDIRLSEFKVDSLSRFDDPLSLSYELAFNLSGEDHLYVKPLFGQAFEKNPFQSAERYYPVEMPYNMDETYLATIEIPAGYELDELPKQLIAKLDEEGSAVFEYRISVSGSTISLRSRVQVKRTLFLPDEYPQLREFFNLIVNKQNEQIVFKKKK